MIKNITIEGFELSTTAKTLVDRLPIRGYILRETFDNYQELLEQGMFAANDLLKELGLNREVWVRLRGKKAFLFCERSRRIIAEFAVDFETDRKGRLKRPKYVLLDHKGLVKEKTIGDLIVKTNTRRFNHKRNYKKKGI